MRSPKQVARVAGLYPIISLAVVWWCGIAAGQTAALPAGTQTKAGITYAKTAGGAELKLDAYLPTAGDGRPMPVLLRISPRRETPSAAAMGFLQQGYALVYASYLPDNAPGNAAFTHFPENLHAAKAAVRWIRGSAVTNGLDDKRIGVWAAGNGASVAALLAMTADQADLNGTLGEYPKVSSAIASLCLFGGTTDWRNAELYGDETVNIPGSAAYQLFGDNPKAAPDAARRASAVNYVRPSSPPVLMVTLSSDANRAMHLIFAETLRRAGVASALYEEDRGAGLSGRAVDEEKLNLRVREFFTETLGHATAAAPMEVSEEIGKLAGAGLYKQAERLIEERLAAAGQGGRGPWEKLLGELSVKQREPAIAHLRDVLKKSGRTPGSILTMREVLTNPERIGDYDIEVTPNAAVYDARARTLEAVQVLNTAIQHKDFTAADRQATFIRSKMAPVGGTPDAAALDPAIASVYLGLYADLRQRPQAWPAGVKPVSFATDFGQDLYGHWFDLKAGGVTARFRYVPPGKFAMGSPADQWGRLPNEPFPTQMTIAAGFWLSETEVTQAMWDGVMGSKDDPSHFKGADLPADSISYAHAVNFARALGIGARLPTDAEWEYACRAGTADMNAATGRLKDSAWFWDEAQDTRDSSDIRILHELETVSGGATGTHPVRAKLPNAWGLYDMQGNVWEWCEPTPGEAGAGADRPRDAKVLKGGSWLSIPQSCRAARSAWFGVEDQAWTMGARVLIPAQ